MRRLVSEYLNKGISRRGFIKGMAAMGFAMTAIESVLDSLTPFAEANTPGHTFGTLIEGTGGDLLVEQLKASGHKFLFNCNSSGTSPIFDALVDRPEIQVIQGTQEGQVVAIANGYALASGQIPFIIVDSAGFPNTLNNMYNAWKDRTPMLICSERQTTQAQGGRDAFEEWDDFLKPAESFTRWTWSISSAQRVPEITRRALKIASTSPGGPVALAFPTDILAEKGIKAEIIPQNKFNFKPRIRPNTRLVEEAAKMLVEAKSPLLHLGAEITRSGANGLAVELAELLSMPVTQAESLYNDFPTIHPLFIGKYTKFMRYPQGIDIFLNIGAKMPDQPDGEVISFPPSTKIIHISVDPSFIGRTQRTDLGIVADAKEAIQDLAQAIKDRISQAKIEGWKNGRLIATKDYTEKIRQAKIKSAQARWDSSPLTWERVAFELDQVLEKDAIIVPELGSAEDSALSWFNFVEGQKSRIGRTTGSALGWGVGAAMGVKLAKPDNQVVSLQGDGGFLFGQIETLWSLARYEVPIIIVIFNNRSYNEPRNRMLSKGGKQAQTGKDMTCYLGDPDVDFAKIAQAFGLRGEAVSNPMKLKEAVNRAVASVREGKTYLIDALVKRTGLGADSTWYPKYSITVLRKKKV